MCGSHTTDTPSSITYSSVVSRDSIRITFLVAALSDLDIMAADIGNAYLNAPCHEKIWTVAGQELGTECGAIFLVTRALYGLKSAGAAWRSFFAQALTMLGFRSTCRDSDVYIRVQTKPDGTDYYEMLLVYINDILMLSYDTNPIMDGFSAQFCLKKDSLGPPKQYLGGTIKIHTNGEGAESWAISSNEYMKAAAAEVVEDSDKQGLKLKGKAHRPYDSNYKPELDVT